MAKEIERKYLLRDLGVIAGRLGARIEQGYIANEPMTVRVRIIEAEAFLTLKSKARGIERDEYEFPIDIRIARELLERHCGGRVLRKIRYRIPHGAHVVEVDVFAGRLEGLVIAEVEFADADEPFEKPAWLGEDVSDDFRLSNSALASAEAPPTPLPMSAA
jgi:CYTH domain-containing protein